MKRQNQLNIKRGLLSKLVLLVALFLGSSNAWAQKTLPYSYGFENNNLATEGWTVVNGCTRSGYETKIFDSSLTSHDGRYSFRFNATTTPPQYLISPELTNIGKNLEVSFYYRGYSNSSGEVSFQVGYSTTDNNLASFTNWDTEITFKSSSYSKYETSFPAGTKYIAIKYNTNEENNYRYLIIDDINVAEDNPYKVPTDFVLSSYTGNSATFSWTAGSDESSWKFAYSTDADFTPNTGTAASITANPYTLTGLTEGTTYYACICADYGGGNYSDWTEKVAFTPIYKMPTNFMVDSYTDNSATFSWTAGSDESSWKLAYSTDADFTPNTGTAASITANPYTLTGLTEGTTYYACICADYGDGHYSDWTGKVSFTPSDEIEKTINEGSDYGGYAPIYGSYTSSITRTQLIIPSSSLTAIRNRQITKITFYTSSESTYETLDWGTSTFEVYLKPISSSSFASSTLESWGTKVYNSATVSVSAHKMEISLNTPYNYTEGNLMIGFKQTGTGAYKYAKWIGTTGASNTLLYGYGDNSNNRTNFNPQITFTTRAISTDPVQMDDNGFTTYASPRPLDLTTANLPSGLKAYMAEVSAREGKVRFTEIDQTVAANTGILLAGTAGNTYRIPVADSGTAVEGNDFLVNSTGGTFDGDDKYTYFGFKKNSDPITFATFNPSTVAIPTNKAYLKVLTNDLPTEAHQLVALFDDGETTSLREIRNEELGIKNAVFFNLNGQRVAQPTKGLYIVNGKKVLVP